MAKELFIVVVLAITMTVKDAEASDCCGAYKDLAGRDHESELCVDYCCLQVGVAYKGCCSDSSRQIPATQNENAECVESWVREHMWVPIVGGIVGLIILIGLCTCCCCCCCGCCRKNPAPVIVHTGVPQSTSVAMASTTTVNANPLHAGYNQ